MTHEIVGEVASDVTEMMAEGEQVRFRYYTGSVSTNDYDDAQTLSQSGTDIWTSGILLPVSEKAQGYNPSAVGYSQEQGKLKEADSILFIEGTVETTDTMKVGFGNPVDAEYSVIPKGVIAIPSHGTPAFKKIFLEYLPTGSLTGE